MKNIMKRAFALVLTLVIVLSTAETSVVYAAPSNHKENHSHSIISVSNKHAHVYNRAVTEKWTDATCENYATQTWACSKYVTKNGKKVLCEEVVTIVTGNKLAHNYVSTATEKSEGVYQCSCGAVEYVACKGCREYRLLGLIHIPHAVVKVADKLVHTHVVVEDAAVDATCETPGLTSGSHCETCGEVFAAQEVIEATGHVWNEGNTEYAPTCTADGSMYYFCTVDGCDASYTEVLPKLGHNSVVVSAKAPTCSEAGYYAYEMCDRCGIHEVVETIPATGHDVVLVPGVEATCTTPGLSDGWNCANCGKVFIEQQEISALGHTEVLVPGTAATCTASGLTDGWNCGNCDKVWITQQVIPALGHTEVLVPGTAATCTTPGLTDGWNCGNCGEVWITQQVIPTTDHKLEVSSCAANATNHGYIKKVCSECNTVVEFKELCS